MARLKVNTKLSFKSCVFQRYVENIIDFNENAWLRCVGQHDRWGQSEARGGCTDEPRG
jgi:hypothetical protein